MTTKFRSPEKLHIPWLYTLHVTSIGSKEIAKKEKIDREKGEKGGKGSMSDECVTLKRGANERCFSYGLVD